MDESDGCARAKLAQLVASPTWLPDSGTSWACRTCVRLASVVLPSLQAMERRLAALEYRAGGLGRRGPGRLKEAVCRDCQRVFTRASVRRKRCDECRIVWKRKLNRR